MAVWRWIVRDGAGHELDSGPEFPAKDDAETWMSAEWSTLLAGGGESVALMHDGAVDYEMGLRGEEES